jgi:hypothetical protein
MRITLQRSGGFGGIRPPAVTVDTETLPAEHARELEALVETSGVRSGSKKTPKAKDGPPQVDRFTYTLTLGDPSGREETVVLNEAELSPAHQSLLAGIKRAAAAKK